MKKVILFITIYILFIPLTYAGSFDFRGTTDKMTVGEEMGDVLEAVTSSHLSDIKGGSVTTKEGTTKYSQFLRFKDVTTALNTSSVLYTKTESDDVGDFLKVNKGTAVTDAFFEWHINFEEGLKSKITDKRLAGLDDVKIPIISDEYTIIDSLVEGKKIKLTLAKGAISDILKQQEKKVYTIGDKPYEIEVTVIETATKKARFKVAGKETQLLQKGEIESIDTGVFIGVNDILINSNDPKGSAVKFFIGASILEIIDENYEDDTFNKDFSFSKEKLEFGFIKIAASLISDTLKISSIKYRLINDQNIYARPGEGIKKHLKKPQGLIADWDIRYAGLESVSTSKIKLLPSGADDEYRLEFTSSEGKTINIPFVSNKGSFKLGDNTKDLIIVEGSSTTDFTVDQNDYFVLTTANTKGGKTYVLTYESLNNESNTVLFNEIGGSQQSFSYTNSSNGAILGEGTIAIGTISAKFYIELASPNRLAIDMDGDGTVQNTDQMDIIVKGGGIFDPGTTNSPTAPYDITLKTDGSQFEESTTSETLTFTIQTTQSTRIGISETITGLSTVKSKDNHVLGISDYGAKVDLLASTDKADTLTIDYPQSQQFAKVVIDVGVGSKIQTKVEESKETQCSNGKQDGDETGVDCGGSCSPCPTCTDSVQNQGEEGIDCGGPCPKICTPQQKQETETCKGCWQQLEKGQKKCIPAGTIVGTLYCGTAGLLVPLKANGESCSAAYECKTGRCEEGKCGRKITAGLLAINIGIVALILIILYFVFTLIK
ncbi:hypothetical protein HYS50_02850 [Candidatus Woesearchaeota archaeon]|nr:hypothetical protein [Candidatus Woesearchaeota archaeon]